MDVRQDAAAGDGDGAQELVQLLVVAVGELVVAGVRRPSASSSRQRANRRLRGTRRTKFEAATSK